MDDLAPWLVLAQVQGVGPRRYQSLLSYFGDPERILHASLEELIEVPGVNRATAQAILNPSRTIDVRKELEQLERLEATVVTLADDDYPPNLKHIHDPPPVLYVRGKLRPEDACAVAVVGSRRCSTYGRLIAERLGEELAGRGITVVSGLARGIDAAAHRGALKASSGRTIAVFGCGIDQIYPHQHADLAAQIADCGALISEFPLGTKPVAENFPRRNRLISGLSLGAVVVEAPARSGALITARIALDQGREVFAVPGHAGSYTSQGTHALIRDGAKLVENVDDIFQELPALRTDAEPSGKEISGALPSLSEEEEKVVRQLSDDPRYIDQISLTSGLDSARVLQLLLGLELKGIVRQLQGQMYIRQI